MIILHPEYTGSVAYIQRLVPALTRAHHYEPSLSLTKCHIKPARLSTPLDGSSKPITHQHLAVSYTHLTLPTIA